ncbi:MAG TPA: alkaline phosphatase family protein, partial [Candidatus Sulfotelmatobacter sp.]|nr:alkaline phosphatase family protein [Candidatus Sulfotelmatobacter sp.]
GLTMGYYNGQHMRLWRWARRYTLADNFFHAAFGGSFLNHIWLICACTPRFEHAPADMVAVLDAAGHMTKDGAVTPDGYAVNTVFTASTPHPAKVPADRLLPLQDMPTIGDRLSAKGVSWAWYSGGWDDALAGKPDKDFQFHHQPFAYFKNYAAGTPGRAAHLQDAKAFFAGIAQGRLPAVSFYKPIGELNQHPGYAEVIAGDRHVAELLTRITKSPLWRDVVVIITPDENGGFWDHVPPPVKDKWGPGTRIPTVIVSPFARRGYIDHTEYDTTSILRFIERRYGLSPLGARDAKANDLTNALKF